MLSNQNKCYTTSNRGFKFKRIVTVLCLLYTINVFNIYLLWTNCVIFTESAQNTIPTNLIHNYHQRRTDDGTGAGTDGTTGQKYQNSNNYSNYDVKSLEKNLTKLRMQMANVSTTIRNEQIDFVARLTAYSNSEDRDVDSSALEKFRTRASIGTTTKAISFPPSSKLSSSQLQIIDVSTMSTTTTTATGSSNNGNRWSSNSMPSLSVERLHKRNRNDSYRGKRVDILWHRKRMMLSDQAISWPRRGKSNKKLKRDEFKFKHDHPIENVIKLAKNHAIKRNVNNFTPEILGTSSNLSIKIDNNPIQLLNNKSVNTEHRTSINTITIPTESITMKLLSSNETELNEIASSTKSISDVTALGQEVLDTMHVHIVDQPNQFINTKSNNTAINRAENNRNNSRQTMVEHMPISTTGAMPTIIATTMPTTTQATILASSIATIRPKSFSPGSTLGRFRVNDVFEMDTKQKYFSNSSSVSINFESRGNDTEFFSGANDGNGTKIISLLGLFELSTRTGLRPEGQSELAAAEMAIRHINKRGLLPGYTLQLITNDTKCDPGVGVDRFFHALYTQYLTRVLMLLGSACSEVTESLAKVVPYWNILQVSFGSTSPALSDRTEFPLFYRTVAPDSSHNPARIAFIRRFGWDTVTTFSQNEEIHSLAVNDLVTELENANISCAATITFAETDFKNQLKMLRDLDTRIIIGSFSHDLAPKIFCEAYKLGMYGADYVWILHEIVGRPWWHETKHDDECSQKQLQEVAENVLMVSSHNSIVSNEISYSGLTYSMFIDELNSMLKVPQPLSRYSAQTYDAVWSIALVLREAEIKWKNDTKTHLQLDRFDYTRYDMALEFLHQFSRLNFLGVSGPVSFSGADRVGISVFNQVQNGHLKSVALFYPSRLHLDFDCLKCVPIKWKSGQVPIAKRVFKLRVATIAPIAFFVVSTVAVIGIILSIAFLAFNLHFRKLKAIKLSSPKLSNITAFGCILVYAAVILLGLDYSTLPANEKAFPIVCTARVYLLSSGFSLAFGSMFAKTYRVHRIFTRSGSSVCKDKMLQDTQLISLVCALLLLDGLVVTLWVLADPMERHLNNLTLEISLTDRSVVYQPQVEVCRSQHTQTWLGALYVYKGLLLVVGVYMAWETRHVKIPALNDSQYIGVSVYSVVITSAIVVVLANLIAERVTLAFITITALILTSTTATLCLLFLPKMHDIWGKGVINDPVIHSMGLKMECNTRRFMIDDKRELQYRVEVQNRVYKKELAALDIEIGKLERMLETPSPTTSSDLSIPRLIKHELAVVNEENEKSSKQRTPSIGGGLPLLLLSVLPPVIPRASWPSAMESNSMMRKSVTFSSQPQLEDESSVARLPAIDLYNLRLTHQQATEEPKNFIERIIGFFGSSKPSSRKASTSSIAGGSSGFAAVFKAHMGLFTNLVPMASSCNAIDTAGIRPMRKMSMAQSGNAIDTRSLSVCSGMPLRDRSRHFPLLPPFIINANDRMRRHSSNTNSNSNSNTTSNSNLPTTSQKNIYVDTDREPKVNFQLPVGRRPSILQTSVYKERVKGSPRFPHRIAPTSSLNALVEYPDTSGTSTKSKWKSLEDSTMLASTSTSTSFDMGNR